MEPTVDDRADLSLFMPASYREQIHAVATRLEVSDSALLSGAWLAARASFAASTVAPKLSTGPSARVFFSISMAIQDEVRSLAEANDRSQSWVFLKAWEMSRQEIEGMTDRGAFFAWSRHAT